MNDDRQGCLGFLLKTFLLSKIYNWLQETFGYKSGNCCGCGCGLIILVVCGMIFLKLFFGTEFLDFGF